MCPASKLYAIESFNECATFELLQQEITMESGQSDDLPFAVSDDRDSSVDGKFDRQQVRRIQNRGYSKNLRQKKKAKVQLLESREAELTEEVTKLRELATQVTTCCPDDGLRDSQDHFQQKIDLFLSNPESTDLTLNALIDELEEHLGVYGKTRIGKLANTLHDTMHIMLPMHVKFSLWISGSETSDSQSEFPKLEDFFKSTGLTPDQNAAFQEYQQTFELKKGELKEAFDEFKKMIAKIGYHARVLHSLIQELRQLLTPRQVAAFIVWLPKNYSFLAADRVLNYGNNSSDFLSSA